MNQIIPPASPVQRYLALDPAKGRARWVILSQLLPGDERPADVSGTGGSSRYEDWEAATQFTRDQTGEADLSLVPVGYALLWAIEPRRTP